MNAAIEAAATTLAAPLADTVAVTMLTDTTASTATGGGHFHTIDYTVFGLLLALSVAIGVYFGFFDGREQTTDEYLLGGRRLRPLPVAVSLVASQLSAYSIVTVPSEIYSFGSSYTMMVVPVVISMTLLTNFGILPVFYNNNIDNCYAYLELRFGHTIRSFTTFIFILSILMILPVVAFLPAFAFAEVSGLNLHLINAVVTFVCISYTMLGGIKAVVWTDVVQAFVMVFSICMVLTCAVMRVGGMSALVQQTIDGERLAVPKFALDLETRQTVWNLGSGLLCLWLAHVAFSQNCVQRLCSLPSLKDARKTMAVFCCGVVVVKATTGAIGLALYAFYKDCDPVRAGIISKADKMVPMFVNEIVGHFSGMPGLFISCVFSASLSTVSAYLNCVSGLLYKDYICRYVPDFQHTERKANLIMKLIICLLGVYCIGMGVLVERSTSLFQVQITMSSLINGAVVGVFTLALFYPWASQKATLCGAFASIVVMACLIAGAHMNEIAYTPLPTSIDGCEARNMTIIGMPAIVTMSSLISPIVDVVDEPSPPAALTALFRMSFQWYPVVGVIIVWLVAIPLTHTLAPMRQHVDPRLISPLVRPLWRSMSGQQKRGVVEDEHTEMRVVRTHSAVRVYGDGEKDCGRGTETVYAVRE